jgi:hypothetical protein
MDAKALSAAAGIEVGTLNAWISRGYVPDITPDAQGRRRDFDVDIATHVVIMAELSVFGFGPPSATKTASDACEALMGNHPAYHGRSCPFALVTRLGQKVATMQLACASEEALFKVLGGMVESSIYLVINTGRIFKKMKKAEDEWQQRRKKTSGED